MAFRPHQRLILPAVAALTVRSGSLAAIALLAVLAHGDMAAGQTADEARQRLDATKKSLDVTQRRKQELQADVKSIAEEYERLRIKSIEQAQAVRASEGKLTRHRSAAHRA